MVVSNLPSPLTLEEETALFQRLPLEDARAEVVMHTLQEAIRFIRGASHGRIGLDEAMSIAYEGLNSAVQKFTPGKVRLLVYAYGYLRGALCERLQSEGYTQDVALDYVLDSEASPGTEEAEQQDRIERALRDALNELTPRQRMVITMRYFLRMKIYDIARLMSRSSACVSRLHRDALAQLKDSIQRRLRFE